VGGRKVDVAAANLRAHNLRSEIETHHCDAMAEWPRIGERTGPPRSADKIAPRPLN
jgi:hypothetical protein